MLSIASGERLFPSSRDVHSRCTEALVLPLPTRRDQDLPVRYSTRRFSNCAYCRGPPGIGSGSDSSAYCAASHSVTGRTASRFANASLATTAFVLAALQLAQIQAVRRKPRDRISSYVPGNLRRLLSIGAGSSGLYRRTSLGKIRADL